jgi:hypothetical protein
MYSVLLFSAEVNTDTIHTMSLVRWGNLVPLALEDVPKMPSAVVAHDLSPTPIGPPPDSTRNRVSEGGPSAARFEFVLCFVERCVAACAGINAGAFGWHVLVQRAGAGIFGALLTKNSKLLW